MMVVGNGHGNLFKDRNLTAGDGGVDDGNVDSKHRDGDGGGGDGGDEDVP